MTVVDDLYQQSGWPCLVAAFGMSVTFVPGDGGEQKTVTGIWELNEELPGYYSDGEQNVSRGVLYLNADDIPMGESYLRDTFTIAGVTWAVVSVGERTPVLELQLETREHVRGGNGRMQR